MAVPATVIYFTCYDQLCAALRARMGERAQEAPLLAGAIARGETLLKEECYFSYLSLMEVLVSAELIRDLISG